MERLLKNTTVTVSILVLACGYLFFAGLGNFALTDPDETFYAQTAREMAAEGEWVTPHLYGKPQFEKPILFYWLVEASYKVFGVNEFAARLPSAVLGTMGVVAIFFLGSMLFGRGVGLFSALILATNVEYVVLSRACITDMALFVFMLLAALFFLRGYMRLGNYCYMLSAASIALAVLTKGPVYLILFAVVILVYLALARDLKALGRMPIWQSALVFAAVTLPWYWAIYGIHGKDFIDGFFGLHNVNRFLVSEHKIGSQVYYNIPIILGGMFPWSAFLPVGFWHIFRKARSEGRSAAPGKDGAIFVLVWFFIFFGFFTVSSTKLPTYIFPCFLSTAMIAGALLDDFLKGRTAESVGRWTKISYYILAVVMLFGWIGGAVYAKLDLPSVMKGAVVSGIVVAFGAALSLFSFIRKRYAAAFAFIALSMVLFLLPLGALILPEVERYETSKEVSADLLKVMKPGEKLGSESNYLAGLAFYTGKFPIDLDKHHMQANFMNSKERVWAVIKEKNHKHLYNPEITKIYVRPSYVVFKVGKRAIVTNEMPDDGRFLVRRESSI